VLRVASPRRRTPLSHHPFFAAGWVDYPTIFVEAGLEIPYSIEVFDQAMQKDFQESVAVSLDVRPYRVKIDNINVAAPHARRLLAHSCEVFFSVRVPDGDEVRAQLILAALTLERVNVQLEQKGLSASLNFVGAPRLARKPCEAGKYRVNADCDSCPSNSSSPAGSVGIQACLCNAVSANGERSRSLLPFLPPSFLRALFLFSLFSLSPSRFFHVQ